MSAPTDYNVTASSTATTASTLQPLGQPGLIGSILYWLRISPLPHSGLQEHLRDGLSPWALSASSLPSGH